MSKVSLDYTELDYAVFYAKRSEEELEDYSYSIQSNIISKLGDLPGEDSSAFISSAISLACKKCEKITEKQQGFTGLSSQLKQLKTDAKYADRVVKNKINDIADSTLEKESIWEKIGSGIYNLFCVTIPDALSELPFFDAIIDWGRAKKVYLTHLKEDVVNWFNTGGGVYIKNIFKGVSEFLAAGVLIAATAIAAAALPVIGTVLACVVIGAGAFYAIYKFANMATITENNLEAYQYYQKAQKTEDKQKKAELLGYANYYSKTDGIVDYSKKKDYGGELANETGELASEGVEVLGQTAETLITFVGIVSSFAKLGAQYGLDGKTIVGYDFSKKNIKTNILKDICENKDKTLGYKDGKFDPVNLIKNNYSTLDDSDKPTQIVKIIEKVSDFVSSGDVEKSKTGWKIIPKFYSEITEWKPLKGLLDPTVGKGVDIVKFVGKTWDAAFDS